MPSFASLSSGVSFPSSGSKKGGKRRGTGRQQKDWNRGIPDSVSLFEGGYTSFLGTRNIVLYDRSMKLGHFVVTSTVSCFQYQKDCRGECPEKKFYSQLLRHSVVFLPAFLEGERK